MDAADPLFATSIVVRALIVRGEIKSASLVLRLSVGFAVIFLNLRTLSGQRANGVRSSDFLFR